MLFSGKKFSYENEDSNNTDTSVPECRNSYLLDAYNCTSVQVQDWQSYDKIIFGLWVKTFGRDFDTQVSVLHIKHLYELFKINYLIIGHEFDRPSNDSNFNR